MWGCTDNPATTWNGLIGFVYGKEKIKALFSYELFNKFNIHRTRQKFENDGIDSFENMAATGISIVDRVIINHLGGKSEKDIWMIPRKEININPENHE